MSERLILVAIGTAASLASAAGVLALDQYGVLAIAPARPQRVAIAQPDSSAPIQMSAPVSAALPAPIAALRFDNRFDFVKSGDLPRWMPASATEPQAVSLDAENPDAWFAETHAEKIAPDSRQLSTAPVQQLPWRTTARPTAHLTPSAAPLRTASLNNRLAEISPTAKKRLAEKFANANAPWPPVDIGLVAIKDQRIIELFARSATGAWKLIHRYPVLAASGVSGPKLRQGDKQVPEGVYGISLLNPNSRYHVSLRVNYPNAFDRQMAAKDGRKDLGGDIMIHGKNVSIGCLAVGDEAAEELFVLADHIGLSNIKLIIAPTDFRRNSVPAEQPGQPPWLSKLYTQVASSMSEFKSPPNTGLLSFFGN